MSNIVYELLAKIGLDDKEYKEKLTGAGDSLKSWGGKAAKIAGGAAKAIGAGIASAGTAAVALGKQAIDAYSEYEQLVGGIETLFGDSADKLKQYAQDAWQTAGLSANEYMDTAISFSGALLKSLGGDTEKAAEMTQTAITDMADQANKYGKTVEEVSATYTSLARGNFQTLDNLFGGMFAGTKSGLEEMLRTAEEYRASMGETVSYSADSYADIVQAIHDISEKTGVAGTTIAEANKTISGSLNAMKAAWKNLITGMADDSADIDKLMDNFVESVNTVGKNIIPRIKTILKGASKLINEAAKELVPMIINVIVDTLPDLATAGVEVVVALLQGIAEALPQIMSAIPQIVEAIINALKENWPAIREAGGKIVEALVLGIADMGWYLGTAFLELLDKLDQQLADFGANVSAKIDEFGQKILDGVNGLLTSAVDKFVEFGSQVGEFLGDVLEKADDYYEKSKAGLVEFIKSRADAIAQHFQDSKQKVIDFTENIKSLIKDAMQWLYDHTIGKLVEVANGVKEKLAQVKQHFQDLIDAAYVWGQDLIVNFADGIANMFPHLARAVNWVTEKISNLLGHSHPKEGPLAEDYKWMPDMMQLFAKGIKDNAHLVTDQIRDSFDFGNLGTAAAPALAGSGTTTNTYNITVNGIEELEELLEWYNSRQVRARMA